MNKNDTCYSISAPMVDAIQVYSDIFDEFCKSIFDALIKDMPYISLDDKE